MVKINMYMYLCLFFFASACHAQEITGTVVKVADGDSFTILTSQKKQIVIRIHGIDAPEKGQDYYQVSKNFLTTLIMHQTVHITKTVRDRYGRTVGIVTVGKKNVNELMLEAGLAWHYNTYDNRESWILLEKKARQNRTGLWATPDATPPWEFRKEKRKKQKEKTILN
jgi:micrococcal nuclease